MKYIFFGSPRFAEIVLEQLIKAGMQPQAVVTNPDKPTGRIKALTPPPVKVLALKNNIEVFQPEKIDAYFLSEMKKLAPEIFVVAAYSKIIPNELIEIPTRGTIGTHPSILPKYRGASPIQGAILEGETTTGVTLYRMDEKVDHGPIYAQKEANIGPNEGYLELEAELAELGGEMLASNLPGIAADKVEPKEQDHSAATFTKKFMTEDGFVRLEDLNLALAGDVQKAETVSRIIRALNPEPGVWTLKDGKRIKLLDCSLENGIFKLTKIQIEGKTPQSARGMF